MSVGIVGTGVVATAARSAVDALGEVPVADVSLDGDGTGDAEFTSIDTAIVIGPAGDDRFTRANALASRHGCPWIAVELGGISEARVDVHAAITTFAGGPGCHTCLGHRVASSTVGQDDGGDGTGNSRTGDGHRDDAGDTAVPDADAYLAGVVAARRALDVVNGETDARPFVETLELPWAEHRWLPIPTCDDCGSSPDRTMELDHRSVSVSTAVERLEAAIDDRVGIVSELGERESFPVPYYIARLSDTTGFSDADCVSFAAGVAADWNAAFAKAVGEALERYCAGVYRTADLEVGVASDRPRSVPPSQFVNSPADDSESIPWVAGRRLTDVTSETGAVVLPAARVFFPPPGRGGVTTGLGLGSSTVEAVLSGLYEVVERDATMINWYSSIDPLGLDVVDDGFETVRRRARAEGLTMTPSLVTVDVDVPVVAVAVHREEEWPRFALGSGADLDPGAAARSAAAEALQNWMELRAMGPDRAETEEPPLARYADDPDRAQEFVAPGMAVPGDSVGPDAVPGGRDELEELVDRIAASSLTPFAARITTADVAALGFEAVRAVVPAAQPLVTGSTPFGDRARNVPEELGAPPELDRERHPYP